MPGEEAWPTQPFPSKPAPFARQRFTVDDLSPYLEPEERDRLRTQILKARNRGLFEPPSTEDTVEMPGDRKSTRLNSSHGYISYAVFCLKKQNEVMHRASTLPLVPGVA